jgi:hypothetical protein
MPRVAFEGDSTLAVRAQKALTEATDQYEKATDKAVRTNRQLEAAAAKVHKNNEGPQQRYNRRIGELAELVKAGKISLDDATKAATRFTAQLEKGAGAGKKAFGSAAIGEITGYLGSMLSIGTAIGAITSALNDANQAAKDAAQTVQDGLDSAGELGQLGDEGAATAKRFARRARRLGGLNPEQANKLGFDVVSANFSEQEQDLLLGIGKSRRVRASGLAEFGGFLRKFQNVFGVDESGDLEQIANKLFKGAAIAQADVKDVAGAVTKFGSIGKSLGFGDEEQVAAFLGIEKQAENSTVAATQLNSFFAQVAKRGLGKKTLLDTIAAIDAEIASGKSAFDVLGETNAVVGYGNLTGVKGFIGEQQQGLSDAQNSGFARSKNGAIGDIQTQAAIAARESLARNEVAKEDSLATQQSLIQAIRAETLAKYGNGVYAYLNDRAIGFADFVGNDEAIIRGAAKQNIVSDSTRNRIEEYLRRQAAAAEKTAKAAERGALNPRQE